MKTKKLKLYVYVQENHGEVSIEASSSEFNSTYCCSLSQIVCAPLTEVEIDVPKISSDEAQKVLSGAMLAALIEERKKLNAETHAKLKQLDQRIADLQCLEFKG